MSVRVRIGPSPTGVPHIGVTRTALFNYLFAKKSKGEFIVRIEDTDRQRFVPGTIETILEILEFLGLKADVGPIFQSKRLPIYQEHAKKLVDSGAAYFCFCATERLAKLRAELEKKGKPGKYDRRCLALSKTEVNKKIISQQKHVIRLKVPDGGKTSWRDLIHGKIEFENNLLDDSVLLKSDSFPTYHLAVVVDDHLMKITHVLRGDEWISSTPKHLILYDYFGWAPPEFGHLPIVLGQDRTKLSKRHGATSVLEYRDEGYLKEALINFMALLGWSPKTDEEIFSLEELIKNFDLKGINPTSPIFNLEKLNWFNKQWIMKLEDDDLVNRLDNFIPKKWDKDLVKKVIPLVRERITTLADFPDWTSFFFEEPRPDFGKLGKNVIKDVINKLEANFHSLSNWNYLKIEEVARKAIKDIEPRVAFEILRIATTGKKVGPPLFESLEILGKSKTLERIENAKKQI